jgi:hypothetical protein
VSASSFGRDTAAGYAGGWSIRHDLAARCARATNGHEVAPPSRVMNSRRLMGYPPFEDHTLPHPYGNAALCITAILGADVGDGSFSSDRPASDAPGMSASLRSRPNLRTAAIRRFVPGPDSCTAVKNVRGGSVYSITASARASRMGGTSMPSIRAVWALITSSNFDDCTTGKSAGFVPLRMRPV